MEKALIHKLKSGLGKACLVILSLSLFVVLVRFAIAADFNKQINYQGKLSDSNGVTVPSGNYNLRFRLYDAENNLLWTETRTNADRVTVTGGLFSVMLGQVSPIAAIDWNQTLYLGVEVGGSGLVPTWDGEMSPRKILGAVPAAFESDRLDGYHATDFALVNSLSNMSSTTAAAVLTVTQNGTGSIVDFRKNGTSLFSVLNDGTASTSALTVANSASISGLLSVNGNGTSTFASNLSVNGDLSVGNGNFGGRLVAEDITATGTLTVIGKSIFGNASSTNLSASGFLSVTGQTNLVNASATNMTISGNMNIGSGTGIAYLTGGRMGTISTSSLNISTTDIIEGNKLFWTNDRFDLRLFSTTTFSQAATIGSSTGQTTILGKTILNNASTTNVTISGTAYIGASTGLAFLTNGKLGTVSTSSLNISTTDIVEGNKLFWSNDLFDQRLFSTTTFSQAAIIGSSTGQTTILGKAIFSDASTTNLSVLGTGYIGRLGVNTASPEYDLDVNGSVRISDTLSLASISSCQSGQALQTDASGQIVCGNVITGGASVGGGWVSTYGMISQATTSDKVVIGASTTPYAKLTVLSGSVATTTMALVASTNQTANILDIYNSSNVLSAVVSASGRVGIGSSTPGSTLSVTGSAGVNPFTVASSTGAVMFTVLQNGNVGIGKAVPAAPLDVNGNIYATQFRGEIFLNGGADIGFSRAAAGVATVNGANGANDLKSLVAGSIYLGSSTASIRTGMFNVATSSTGASYFYVGNNGNIGIGTSTPNVLLSLGTTIASKKLAIYDGAQSFYGFGAATDGVNGRLTVFANDYERMSILDNGNIGIGSTSPSNRLGVAGSGFFAGDLTATNITATGTLNVSGKTSLGAASTTHLTISTTATLGSLSSAYLAVNQNGQIIATTTPVLSGTTWGSITGTLSAQADLNSALALKVDISTTSMASLGTLSGLATIGSTTGSTNVLGNLGIGSSTPLSALSVTGHAGENPFTVASSSGNVMLTVLQNGNVGIGTVSPAYKLDVSAAGGAVGVMNLTNTDDYSFTGLWQSLAPNLTAGHQAFWSIGKAASSNNRVSMGYVHAGDGSASNRLDFSFYSGLTPLSLLASGNVGIGTTTPSNKLEVAGSGFFSGNLTAANISATGTLNVSGKTTLGAASTTHLTISTTATIGSLSSTYLAVNQSGQIIATTTPISGVSWGQITGTLSSQTDLNNALGLKVDISTTSMASLGTLSGLATIGSTTGTTTVLGKLGVGTTNPGATFEVGSATNYIYNLISGKGNFIGGNYNLSETAMGTLNVSSNAMNAGNNTGLGPSITFTQNVSQYVAGYEKVIGGIKAYITTATNTDENSSLGFYTHTGTSLTEKLTINSAGNVGIGTTTPNETLHLVNSNAAGKTQLAIQMGAGNSASDKAFVLQGAAGNELLAFTYSGNVSVSSVVDNNNAYFQLGGNGLLLGKNYPIAWSNTATYSGTKDVGLSRFATGTLAVGNGTAGDFSGTLIAGNIGIGTTSPTNKLEVSGSGYFSGNLTAANITATGTLNISGKTTLVNASTTDLTVSNRLTVGSLSLTTPLGVTSGGTGINSVLKGDLIVGSNTNTLTTLEAVGVGYVLRSAGVNTQPAWGKINGTHLENGDYNIGGNFTAANITATGTLNVTGTGSSTIAGDVVVDTNLLYINSVQNRVGIGSSTPLSTLSLQGIAGVNPFTIASSTGNPMFTVLQNGNIGIGSTTPTDRLSVAGTSSAIVLLQKNSAQWDHTMIWHDSSTAFYDVGGAETGLSFRIGTGGLPVTNQAYATIMTMLPNGNVGIGTTTPIAKLAVTGDGYLSGNLTVTNIIATGTLNVTGKTTLGAASTTHLTISTTATLGSLSSTYLAVNQAGQIIATTTPSSGVSWGAITGTLSNQTDLNNALALKVNISTTSMASLGTLSGLATIGSSTGATNVLGNLGIGSSTPLSALSVSGHAGENPFTIASSTGNVMLSVQQNGNVVVPGAFYDAVYSSGGITYTQHAQPSQIRASLGANSNKGFVNLNNSSNTNTVTIDAEGSSFFNGGNVGIGMSSPGTKLEILGTASSTGLQVNGSTNVRDNIILNNYGSKIGFDKQLTNYYLGAVTAADGVVGNSYYGWTLKGNNNLGLRIDTTGNIGIGTSSPSTKLEVNGPGYFSGNLTAAGVTATGTLTTNGGLNVLNYINGDFNAGYYTNGSGGSAARTYFTLNSNGTSLQFVTVSEAYRLANNSAGAIIATNSATPGDLAIMTGGSTAAIRFLTNSTGGGPGDPGLAMSITSDRNVGIGTSTPTNKLEVNGSGYFSGNLTTASLTVNGNLSFQNASTTNISAANTIYPGHTIEFPSFKLFDGQAASTTASYQFLAVQNKSNAYPATLYIVPKGGESPTRGKFEIFNTNYAADQYNYNSLTLRTRLDPTYGEGIYIGSNRYGTPSQLPIHFTMDSIGSVNTRVLTMNTDGTMRAYGATTFESNVSVLDYGTTAMTVNGRINAGSLNTASVVTPSGTLTITGNTVTTGLRVTSIPKVANPQTGYGNYICWNESTGDFEASATGCAGNTPHLLDADRTFMGKIFNGLTQFDAGYVFPLTDYKFDSNYTFTIQNVDPETQYFDSVSLQLRCHTGEDKVFVKKTYNISTANKGQESLMSEDGKYLRLKQGEETTFSFPQPAIADAAGCKQADFTIYSKGYFVRSTEFLVEVPEDIANQVMGTSSQPSWSSSFSSLAQHLIGMSDVIDQMVEKVVDGVVYLKKIVVASLTVDQGVTTKDKITGEYYCMYVSGGEVKTVKGKCDEMSQPSLEPVQNQSQPDNHITGTTTQETGDTASSTGTVIVSTTTQEVQQSEPILEAKEPQNTSFPTSSVEMIPTPAAEPGI